MSEIKLSELSIRIEGGKVEASISARELSYAVARHVVQQVGEFDDGGCDWTTTSDGRSCVNGQVEWAISEDPCIATLIDAMNILRCGKPLKAVLYGEPGYSES